MFQSPDFSYTLSWKLSEVLEDVGLNEEMVLKRRRVNMLMENIQTMTSRSIGMNNTVYYFGSQSEGTTTQGLKSDTDILIVDHDDNVIQDWSEWKQNKNNLLMIQDEDVTPGYCFLQLLRSDEPLFETSIPNKDFIRDKKGRILLKHILLSGFREDAERHGPSIAVPGTEGYTDTDIVFGLPCNSLPQSASHSTDIHSIGRWPTSEMIRYAVSNGCFVVGTSSKISTLPELEWRISTSLGERCFMFNLNITQLHCYVLMKIILKTFFLAPQRESALSSYMCKTVVLHCVQNTDRNIWKKNNLVTCLSYCLLELQSCIQNENCPHFIIPENNLMAGQFTAEEKLDILRKISDIIQSVGSSLLRISIDGIGNRLQVKLQTDRVIPHGMLTPRDINENISGLLYKFLATDICIGTLEIYNYLSNGHIDILKQYILKLAIYSAHGSRLEQFSSRCLEPILFSTYGSIIVSSNIGQNIAVQYQALKCLFLGLNSDVTSGRLKLASVLYSLGCIDRVEFILRHTEKRYKCNIVEPVCGCWTHPFTDWSAEFKRKCRDQNEDCVNRITSFCVRFMQTEVNCAPRELQYELNRSTQNDMQHRSVMDKRWMDFAVIDSLPFLYLLQYKVYGHLQRHRNQHKALCNLVNTTVFGKNLGHRETALNLVGQCMEQGNKPMGALQSYKLSLQLRGRNNAAKFHICNLLSKHASRI